MTGEDRFLKAAETGVEYLREHLRNDDTSEGVTYWYHAIEINEPSEKKILASEFGDDYQAIPAYEQIYALVGPTQLYRITGDPQIKDDIDTTISLFERFFYDPEYGGYWSHLDPISFDGKSDALGRNRARKNWNSVGDHVPAYLINAWLATGDDKYMRHARLDRRHDRGALPGRRQQPVRPGAVPRGLEPRPDLGLAAEPGGRRAQPQDRLEPDAHPSRAPACQLRRAGQQDQRDDARGRQRPAARRLVRRRRARPRQGPARRPASPGTTARPGGSRSRRSSPTRSWPARPATTRPCASAARRPPSTTRSSSTTRRASVYFNVLANGIPYLLGTERQKGSHSMAGYHSFELAYLSTVYTQPAHHQGADGPLVQPAPG